MIGVATIKLAVIQGTHVYSIVRDNTSRLSRLPKSHFVHLVYGDLNSLSDIDGLPPNADVFYHFAWAGTKKAERDNPVIQERNIPHILDAVELAKRCGCKKFIGAGSQAEYGQTEGVIDDRTRFKPTTSYGMAKFAAGFLSRKLCEKYDMCHIWGRIFSVYGENDNEGTVLDYAIKRFIAGKEAYFSSGMQMWDYLNEEDAGRIFYLLGKKKIPGGDYNVAFGQSRPLRYYIEYAAQMLNAQGLCHFDDNCVELNGFDVNINKTVETIGFKPEIEFTKGIESMINAYKADDCLI